jgi:putative Mg2+ transporter-C (MgtC) family protein
VQGLTTSAGVWMTAAMASPGLGREATALLSTVLALVVRTAVPHLVGKAGTDDDDAASRGDNRYS